jgi:hypothetical protein
MGGQSIARCLNKAASTHFLRAFFRDTVNMPTLDGVSSWWLPMRHALRDRKSAALTVASLFQAIKKHLDASLSFD